MNTFYPGNDYRNYLSHARTNRRKSLRDHRVEQVRKATLMPGEHPDRDTGNMNGHFHRPSPGHEDPEQQRGCFGYGNAGAEPGQLPGG